MQIHLFMSYNSNFQKKNTSNKIILVQNSDRAKLRINV